MIFPDEKITPPISVPDASQQSGALLCDTYSYEYSVTAKSLTFTQWLGWKTAQGVFKPVKQGFSQTVGGDVSDAIRSQLLAFTTNPLTGTPAEFIALIKSSIASSAADLKAKRDAKKVKP